MSEGKRNIIAGLLQEYDIRTAKDIRDGRAPGIQFIWTFRQHRLPQRKETPKNTWNFGEAEIEVPQDRDGSFEPKVVQKRQKDISGIEQKIISLYAKGMTTRQISETIEDIYGFEVSDGMVSDITDRLLPQIEEWCKWYSCDMCRRAFRNERSRSSCISADRITALHCSSGEKYTEICWRKNKKEFANDLKTIYQAPSEKAALEQLERVTEKWEKDYPNAMKSRHTNRDVISPIFKFSAQVRKVIYTTNAIESLNSGYRRLNKQRSVFPSDTALLKALYPATTEISKKWTMPLRDWGKVLGELEILFLQSFFRRDEFFFICWAFYLGTYRLHRLV